MIDAGTASIRVVIYLNRRIKDEDFEVLTINPDLITIQLHLAEREGEKEKVLIYIVYNPLLRLYAVREPSQQLQDTIKILDTEATQILLGDFNLYYSVWGGSISTRHVLVETLL